MISSLSCMITSPDSGTCSFLMLQVKSALLVKSIPTFKNIKYNRRREGSRTLKSPTAHMWWMFIICCVWTLYGCDHSSILIISLHFFSGEHSYILTAHFLHKLFIIKVCFLLVIKGLTQHAAPVKRSVLCFLQRFQMSVASALFLYQCIFLYFLCFYYFNVLHGITSVDLIIFKCGQCFSQLNTL